MGNKYKKDSVIIDVESLGNSDEFKDLLGYLNTATGDQVKGMSGGMK